MFPEGPYNAADTGPVCFNRTSIRAVRPINNIYICFSGWLCSFSGALSGAMMWSTWGQRWRHLRVAVLTSVRSATPWFLRTEWTATSTRISLPRMKITIDTGGRDWRAEATTAPPEWLCSRQRPARVCAVLDWNDTAIRLEFIYLILKKRKVHFSLPIIFF